MTDALAGRRCWARWALTCRAASTWSQVGWRNTKECRCVALHCVVLAPAARNVSKQPHRACLPACVALQMAASPTTCPTQRTSRCAPLLAVCAALSVCSCWLARSQPALHTTPASAPQHQPCMHDLAPPLHTLPPHPELLSASAPPLPPPPLPRRWQPRAQLCWTATLTWASC